MNIVKDERDDAIQSTCVHCGVFGDGRYEEIVDAFGANRGYSFLCFDCFAPRIFWKPEGTHSKMYASPVKA